MKLQRCWSLVAGCWSLVAHRFSTPSSTIRHHKQIGARLHVTIQRLLLVLRCRSQLGIWPQESGRAPLQSHFDTEFPSQKCQSGFQCSPQDDGRPIDRHRPEIEISINDPFIIHRAAEDDAVAASCHSSPPKQERTIENITAASAAQPSLIME